MTESEENITALSQEKLKVSIITVLHGETEFIPLLLDNYRRFLDLQELEIVVVDDGPTSLASHFTDVPNCLYLHLSETEISEFFVKILEGFKEPNKSPLYYQQRLRTLPLGFKRDYGSGMSSHPYIFHMNADCIYDAKAIDRKVRFLARVGAECTYNDTTLCYDIYNQKLYKTISEHKLYESTLCHTREFWKRKGFQWSDVEHEGKYFHYNNGNDRKQDYYYDTIQLLSIHNMNLYKPVEVTVEGKVIKIPDIVSEIQIETHPFVKAMNDIYGQKPVTLLGINSEFLENVTEDSWETFKVSDKWKQTKLAKQVKGFRNEFNVLVFGSKHPAWDLFEHVPFDLVMLETHKNSEQMVSILTSCKKHPYICVQGVFVRKDFLEPLDTDKETDKEWENLEPEPEPEPEPEQ